MDNPFTKDSQAVQSALHLLSVGYYRTVEELPDLFNLKAVVQEELDKLHKKE